MYALNQNPLKLHITGWMEVLPNNCLRSLRHERHTSRRDIFADAHVKMSNPHECTLKAVLTLPVVGVPQSLPTDGTVLQTDRVSVVFGSSRKTCATSDGGPF